MFDVHPTSPYLNGVTDIRFDKYYDKSEHLCYPKLCTTNLSLFKAQTGLFHMPPDDVRTNKTS